MDWIQWSKVTGLILILTVVLSLACSTEQDTPQQPEVPTAVADPTNTPQPPPTTENTPTPTIAAREPEIPEAATPSPENIFEGDRSTAILLAQSSSAFQPVRPPSPPRLGNVQLYPLNPQQTGDLSGLTVFAVGSITVASDEVYVVVAQERFGRIGPQPLSSDDRADVVERLAEIGISEADVEFETSRRYGPYTNVVVEVPAGQLPQIGEDVIGAVEDALGRSDFSGLQLGLSDESCDSAMSQARREVIPQAQASAADLAQALGVSLGPVTGALEYPNNTVDPYGPSRLERCSPPRFFGPEGLMPLDSSLEMDVPIQLQISFAIE